MDIAQKRMAMVFDEWARRYAEDLEGYPNLLDEKGKPIESYGEKSAAYFIQLTNEMDDKGLLPKP